MNYNSLLCNYCVSSTGKSNFNVRVVKPSDIKMSNTIKISPKKIERKIESKKKK
ncbi:unknown [Clostridium sp. CAG:492]|nr:unknown [Clostridium sp. CAG:492]